MKNFISNFSRKPQGNDRAQIIAVSKGEAEIAIANSYYIGLMLSGKKGEDQKDAAERVKIHFPNQDNRGTHMNISGAGILKNSPNYDNAVKFLEFLLTEEAQKHIINNKDRIAQMILTPVIKMDLEVTDDLPETIRGEGGFGSTGK